MAKYCQYTNPSIDRFVLYYLAPTKEVSRLGDYSLSIVCAIIASMSQYDQKQIEELYAVVVGYVQGVGFRYFVAEKAQRLGLHGYVRNETNGDVEVVAQGIRPALEHLLMALRQGPSAAQVHEVHTTWRQPTRHLSGFHIRF